VPNAAVNDAGDFPGRQNCSRTNLTLQEERVAVAHHWLRSQA